MRPRQTQTLVAAVVVLVVAVAVTCADGQAVPCTQRSSCNTCTTAHGPSDPLCVWCGSYSTGECIPNNGICPRSKEEMTRTGGSCPPSPLLVVLPVVVLYSVLTLATLAQHAYESLAKSRPRNVSGPLHQFDHLATRDSALVRSFADVEGIEYADYEQPRDSTRRFMILLACTSAAVLLAVVFQERMGTAALVFAVGWWLFCVYMLVVKALRKSRIYILTESRAVVVEPKWFGVWGRHRNVYLAEEMRFLSVRSYRDGLGSVFFTTEDERDDSPEAMERITGFDNIARAEEVYRLMAVWRAELRGEAPPSAIVRSPKKKATACDKAWMIAQAVLMLAFLVAFGVLFISGEENGSYLWYVWILVPYALIWLVCFAVWARSRWILHKRESLGFMSLGTAFSQPFEPTSVGRQRPPELSSSGSSSSGSSSGSSSTSSGPSSAAVVQVAAASPAASPVAVVQAETKAGVVLPPLPMTQDVEGSSLTSDMSSL